MSITDARPLHVRIADDLRTDIETGRLKAEERLPTLDELATRYRCSLAVIRKSLELLRQQGLVTTRQGFGSFVRLPPRRVLRSSERHQCEKDLALASTGVPPGRPRWIWASRSMTCSSHATTP